MAQSDWFIFDGSLDKDSANPWFGSTIRRLVTSGVARPPGASGGFVFGFNSLATTAGAVALGCNINNFAPIQLPDSQGGGSIRGCVKRGVGGGRTGFSPFLFIGAQNSNVAANGYILGLEDAYPSRLILAKGPLVNGAPNVASPGQTRILRHSVASYDWDIWHHLRLDMIVNVNGSDSDVILRAYRSPIGEVYEGDLKTCDNPEWLEIAFNDDLDALHGAGAFKDDALAVNSGSLPFASGYVGLGFRSQDIARRAYFDYMEVMRQSLINPPA